MTNDPGAAEAAAPRGGAAPRAALAVSIALLAGLELGARLSGIEALGWAARGALAALVIAAIPRLGLREAYLFCLCAGLTWLAFARLEEPWRALGAAADQGAFLAAFILLLALLNEAAMGSPSVARLGAWLTAQPPGRRYATLFWGTNLMALTFNLGAVSLLTPLVRRGLEIPGLAPAVRAARERRQVNAILRGLAWNVVWSPTALAGLAVLELIDGIDRRVWTLWGLGLTVAVFCLGWAEDRLSISAAVRRAGAAARTAPPFPSAAGLGFLAATLSLLSLAVGVSWASGGTLVLGLLTACPVMAAGWFAAQARTEPAPLRAAALRLTETARERLPDSAPVAVTLAASGFIGRLAADLMPSDALSALLDAAGLPGWALLTAIPVAIVSLSFLAVSPIMTAVFFGALFGAMDPLPADPTLLALSISTGWALSMTASPFATVVLLLTRLTGREGWRLTMAWNWRFTLLALGAVAAVMALATGGR